MPKYFDVVHNGPEWDALRLGIATSSSFDKIVTPGGNFSTQSDGYANQLIAELMTGHSVNDFTGNHHTERGHELEPEARETYNGITDNDVTHAGFITDDLFRFGCSPDGLIKKSNGGLEIKCPSAATHIDYLINQTFDKKYKPQYQGQMLIAQLDYVDFFSYHPELPPVRFTIEPDLEFQKTMWEALEEFHASLIAKIKKLTEAGHLIKPKAFPENHSNLIMAG